MLALISAIARYNLALPLATPATTDFADALAQLRRIARPGSSVFIISDFRGAGEQDAREQLFQLAQHIEVTAIACSDPLEAELPRAGHYAVTDGRARSDLDTADKKLRSIYSTRARQQRELLAGDLLRLGIPLLQATTHQSPFSLLQQFYGDPRR